MDKRHEQSLLHALDILGSEYYKDFLKSLYLYGSCARGREQKFHSDVDIFLFVKANMPKFVIQKLRTEISPDDYTLPEVNLKISMDDVPTSSRQFNRNFEKDGILLWSQK